METVGSFAVEDEYHVETVDKVAPELVGFEAVLAAFTAVE